MNTEGDTPFAGDDWIASDSDVNMNEIVGQYDILFVCLDTLRYDVAVEEEEKGTTPVINAHGGPWEKRHAPGNFTYPSHQAMFAGFLPTLAKPMPMNKREMLFFPKDVGLGGKPPANAFAFEGATFIEGLAKVGYQTNCVGGVAFFNKRSDIGKVLPSFFEHSYWQPAFSPQVPESTAHQIKWIKHKLLDIPQEQRMFWYVNIDAIHYPNAFYLEGAKTDSKATHAAALHYVDSQLGELLDAFGQRGPTFVILCSDHGTCYGEDGYQFHCVNHPMVYEVPYKHFILNNETNAIGGSER